MVAALLSCASAITSQPSRSAVLELPRATSTSRVHETDCDTKPWLPSCGTMKLSTKGLSTLKLIAAKADLIAELKRIDEARHLVAFLEQVNRLNTTPSKPYVSIALDHFSAYLDVASIARSQLRTIGWRAIHHDIELHLTSLQVRRAHNEPEYAFFERLRDTLPNP